VQELGEDDDGGRLHDDEEQHVQGQAWDGRAHQGVHLLANVE
jgi:hypothetical protein